MGGALQLNKPHMERRFNIETQRYETQLKPLGLPAIWLPDYGFCKRCESYGECLGYKPVYDYEMDDEKMGGEKEGTNLMYCSPHLLGTE
jgi:hypothetical protein